MTHEEAVQSLISVLKAVLADAGEDDQVITPDTIPINDLSGFDSILGVALTVRILDEWGIGGDKPMTFFASENDGETKLLNINEIATKILDTKKRKA